MSKKIIFILAVFIYATSFGQAELRPNPYAMGHIILKKGNTTLKGYIKLNHSEWDVRFKDSIKQRKSRKVKYKNIAKIIIDTDSSNPREFYYMKSNRTKFLNFVEKVYSNKISIYTKSSDELSAFYAGFDRRTAHEWMNDMRYETSTHSSFNFFGSFNMNFGIDIEIPSTDYFLLKEGEQKIIYIGTEGNLIRKGFKKFAIAYFNDCSILVEKLENKEYELLNLPEVIEYYNNRCNNEINQETTNTEIKN